MDASDISLVKKTITMAIVKIIIKIRGSNIISRPMAQATPLPPLNFKKKGKQWPNVAPRATSRPGIYSCALYSV